MIPSSFFLPSLRSSLLSALWFALDAEGNTMIHTSIVHSLVSLVNVSNKRRTTDTYPTAITTIGSAVECGEPVLSCTYYGERYVPG